MIRNTHAIIEYIRSNGDWSSVSRTLGNSISISMRHYVPPEIKNLLRERKVRQHQNEMLYVASAGHGIDPALSMDLSSRDDIEKFLANAIKCDASKTNVLLRALAEKTEGSSKAFPQDNPAEASDALFSLTEHGLALLFRYEECLNDTTLSPEVLDRPSVVTGITPNFWRSLASHIRRLFGAHDYANLEHKAVLSRAMEILPSLRTSITFDAPW